MRAFFQSLSEKDKRRYAALEATKLGHGGITYIAAVLGCSIETIRRGQQELPTLLADDAPERIRRKGGGRKPYRQTHPEIDTQFLSVIDDYTAGDPMQEQVRWTNLTQEEIAQRLEEHYGTKVSTTVIKKLLTKHGFRQRKALKKKTMKQVEDRDAQFEKIARLKADYLAKGQPIISIDTKKKELLGPFYREGRLFTQGVIETYDHDWPSHAEGVVVPHGIYDLVRNRGFVTLGTSRDTSEFACESLRRWWHAQGRPAWAGATSILLLCDGGGSSGCRHWIFKQDLQQLVDEIGIEIRVAHYPPYCSKYNPIEHRLFPHLTRACKGVLFRSVERVKSLMEKAQTKTGLRVAVEVFDKLYARGRKVATDFKETMRILFDEVMPQWNYRVVPAHAPNSTIV